jgi:hypothetical protein
MHALLEERQRLIVLLGEEGMHSYTPIVIDSAVSHYLILLGMFAEDSPAPQPKATQTTQAKNPSTSSECVFHVFHCCMPARHSHLLWHNAICSVALLVSSIKSQAATPKRRK